MHYGLITCPLNDAEQTGKQTTLVSESPQAPSQLQQLDTGPPQSNANSTNFRIEEMRRLFFL